MIEYRFYMSFNGLFACLLALFIAPKVHAMACWSTFSNQYKSILRTGSILRTQEMPHYSIHNGQTVFYSGNVDSDGRITFQIPGGLGRLASKFQGIHNSDTVHGDIRNPVYILGPELSRLFGWEFQILDPQLGLDGPMTMSAPGSRLYEKRILQVNNELVSNQKDPIAILPRQAGFLNADQLLSFSVSRLNENVEMNFPNEDRHAMLTPHEASYHMNIIFPRELLRRGSNITILVRDFANKLRQLGGPSLNAYADAIVQTRSRELDVASGASTTMLAEYRAVTKFNRPMQNFNRQRYEEFAAQNLATSIETWSRPTLTPFEVLLQELIMYDRSFASFLKSQKPIWMENLVEQAEFTEQQRLSYVENPLQVGISEIHQQLLIMLVEYRESHKSLLKPPTRARRDSHWWAQEVLTTIDQRVEEITAALIKVHSSERPQ